MIIAGLQKLSLIDCPGKIGAIVFVFGCNFRCGYCHNPELVDIKLKPREIPLAEIFDFLEQRKDKLEAVTITGGEPTLYQELPDFIQRIRQLGFLVKLDTNGTNPEMLRQLIDGKLVDYLAMDIKAPLERYEEVTNWTSSREAASISDLIKKSIEIIMGSGLNYEFRSTLVPSLHSVEDFRLMAGLIKGAKNYYLQNFVNQGKILNNGFKNKKGFSKEEMKAFQDIASQLVKNCFIR